MSASPALADGIDMRASSACSLASSSNPGPVASVCRKKLSALTLQANVFTDLVCNVFRQTLLDRHLLAHIGPRRLKCQHCLFHIERGITLSSLSTADEIARVLSAGTPASSKIPSKTLRWLI